MTGPSKYWSLDDIRWDAFDPARVDADLVCIVKAASLVEYNGGAYTEYLNGVFYDDPAFQAAARQWGGEEIQHGLALARWARLADPSFDFEAVFARFSEKITLPVGIDRSVRGSRAGELVARCMVEVGTSSYYSALRDAADEPVLKEICRRIAQDEIRHYGMFYRHMVRYLAIEPLGRWERMKVALSRMGESEDDELAFAYHAANDLADPYDRAHCIDAYMLRAYRYYQPRHVERAVAMILKAVGVNHQGRLPRVAAALARWFLGFRIHRMVSAKA